MLWDGMYFCGWGCRAQLVFGGFVLEVVWIVGKIFRENMSICLICYVCMG
jgi:hypothetical protein